MLVPESSLRFPGIGETVVGGIITTVSDVPRAPWFGVEG